MNEKAKNQPLILAIETATRAGSVAIARGDDVMSLRVGDAAVSHSANLIELIESALQEAGTELSDIDFFAAANGPGSFTGLRIGLATIKGFAACTGRKIAPISTLAAIAHASGESQRTVALLPAGRGEFFAQMFSVVADDVKPLDSAAHLSPKELLNKYDNLSEVKWTGEAVQLLGLPPSGEGLASSDPALEGGTQDTASGPHVLAVSVARLALRSFREGKLVAPEDLHADYLRASDAEINERWRQQKAQAPA